MPAWVSQSLETEALELRPIEGGIELLVPIVGGGEECSEKVRLDPPPLSCWQPLILIFSMLVHL